MTKFYKSIAIMSLILCSHNISLAEPQSAELRLGAFYPYPKVKHLKVKNLPSYLNIQYLFKNINEDAKSVFARPRPHIGCMLSVNGGTNQLYGGVTWHVPIRKFFLELSFGGEIHDSPLKSNPKNKKRALGTRLLFREGVAIGANVKEQLTISMLLDHASNASIVKQNSGLTGIGLQIGFKL